MLPGSLASAALPSALFAVIAAFGWRAGYLLEALLVLAIALPAVYFWIDPEHIAVPVGAFADPNFPAPRVSVWEDRMHP